MTVKLGMRVFWNHGPMPVTTRKNARLAMTVPFGAVMNLGGGAVNSVNGQTGDVTLTAADVEAASTDDFQYLEYTKTSYGYVNGRLANKVDNDTFDYYIDQTQYALSQKASIQQLNAVKALAESNELKVSTKAEQSDLDAVNIQVETNRLAILTKADQTALANLILLVNTKADQAYVAQQIANLVGTDAQVLASIQAISDALAGNEDLLDALEYTVANRVRFDVANQALTALQKYNARTNIGAEEAGTAALLMAQITLESLGAATAAQGDKADTALQSGDMAPVAFTGLFSSLTGIPAALAQLLGLSPANDDILQRKAGAWVNRTIAQFKTDLGLGAADSNGFIRAAGSAVDTSSFAQIMPLTNAQYQALSTADKNLASKLYLIVG